MRRNLSRIVTNMQETVHRERYSGKLGDPGCSLAEWRQRFEEVLPGEEA
jgi:hypothetical protein